MIKDAPLLERNTVQLTGISEDDIEEIERRYAWRLPDPRIQAGDGPWSRTILARLANAISFDADDAYIVWIVRRKSDNTAIGAVAFAQHDSGDAHMDISPFDGDIHNRLLATALRTVMAWAFAARPDLQLIRCGCDANDDIRRRLLRMAGLRHTRDHLEVNTQSRTAPRIFMTWEISRTQHHGRSLPAPGISACD